MVHPFADDAGDFVILINQKREHSLWPAWIAIPEGWTVAARKRSRQECLDWVRAQRAEVRPEPLPCPNSDACVHEHFEAQVHRVPRTIAVTSGDRCLTYADLNSRANRFAGVLRSRGVGPNVLVGVCGARSPALVAAVLSVLKAGGGYVPLSASYPPDRIRQLVQDARLSLVLTSREVSERSCFAGLECIVYDGEEQTPDRETANVRSGARPDDIAVVVYTSGSTGHPKGVAIPHRAIIARLEHGYPCRERDLQRASLSVVGHFSDLLMPLASGLTVRIVDDSTNKDLRSLAMLLWENGTTRTVFVPSQLRALLEAGDGVIGSLANVDMVIVSGEPISPALVCTFRRRLPHAALINGYGAAEVAGIVTSADVTVTESITVGHPMTGSDVYVLDALLNPVPPGAVGELYIAGAQLACGYLYRPDLTAERFVADPFTHGDRMYRTGDLGRRAVDGSLEVVGRDDSEVKVRGYRVHLNEIESALEALPCVRSAVVVPRNAEGDTRLVAYVVPWESDLGIDIKDVREGLASVVPGYMVPSVFSVMDQLPTLPNGKIDRVTLAARASDVAADRVLSRQLESSTSTEQLVAQLWCQVLNVPAVDRNDGFIDAGGDSLDAIRVALRVEGECGIDVSPEDLLANLTVRELAASIDERRARTPGKD